VASTVNNMVVDSLRSGKASGITGLFSLGLINEVFSDLDYVTGQDDPVTGETREVLRKPIWSWVHEAPLSEAAEVFWSLRLTRELESKKGPDRAKLLQKALTLSVDSALISQHGAPLHFTWERMLEWTVLEPLWARDSMLAILETQSLAHGDRCVGVLQGLSDLGYVVRPDFSTWACKPQGLMEESLKRGFSDTVQFLLEVGGTLEKQKEWQKVGDTALAQLMGMGEEAYGGLGLGDRLVSCALSLYRFSPETAAPLAPALVAACEEAQHKWKSIPLSLREMRIERELPLPSISRKGSKPRF